MATISNGTWKIDPSHSEVAFSVRHLVSKVRGKFEEFSGEIVVADDAANARATAEINMASINTGTQQRDDHLRSSDFFAAEESPTMTFASTGIKGSGDEYIVTGDLTIRGVTKPVEIEVEVTGEGPDPWGGTRAGFEGTTSIRRGEFGIDFNIPVEGDRVMIGDKISIFLSVEAVLEA